MASPMRVAFPKVRFKGVTGYLGKHAVQRGPNRILIKGLRGTIQLDYHMSIVDVVVVVVACDESGVLSGERRCGRNVRALHPLC